MKCKLQMAPENEISLREVEELEENGTANI